MNTKLRNALQKFQQGNTKQFSTIYEEVIHTVYDQIFETFQNESISQHITLHTMDCILNQLYTKNIEIEDLKTFEDQIHHITLGQIEKYQNLTTDNTKNPNFFTQLKLKLLNKLKEKKKADPTHIFFYFEHFRFYFTGFCIAAALGLIAFLLGFLTINKSPIIMSNPKLIVTTGPQAFGELKTLSEKELGFITTPSSEIRRLIQNQGIIFSSAAPQYRISEKQIPTLPSHLSIAKERTLTTPTLSKLFKNFQLPALQLSKFKNTALNAFEIHYENYTFNFDLANEKLNIKNIIPQNEGTSAVTQEKEITQTIRQQFKQWGINIDHYGNFQYPATEILESDNVIEIFIPLQFQGKAVYAVSAEDKNNDEKIERLGMTVYFDIWSKSIAEVKNYSYKSYTTSSYPKTITTDQIFESLSQQGVGIKTRETEQTTTLNKGEEVYLAHNTYLLPALKYQRASQILFVPLF